MLLGILEIPSLFCILILRIPELHKVYRERFKIKVLLSLH